MNAADSLLCPCFCRRRSDAGGRHKLPESKLQVACVAWANAQNLLVVGHAGGAAYLHGGRTANALKAKGVTPGIPDLLILEPGFDGTHSLAVELKIDGNGLSADQRAWFEKGRARQWRCVEARSLDQFQALVREHQTGVIEID